MKKENISAYIIPSTDEHLGEFTLSSDQRLQYISDFTGSSGLIVVTEDKALLWADSRYYIQANNEIDNTHWQLMKYGEQGVPDFQEWLVKNLQNCSQVGVDPALIDSGQYKFLQKHLKKNGMALISIKKNLIDKLWIDRPAYPDDKVYVHDLKYAGENWEDKIDRVHKELNGSSLIISALDEIAWLTNLRGSDFEFIPMFRAFAILTTDQLKIYISPEKITPAVKKHLQSSKIQVRIEDYNKFWDDLVELNNEPNDILIPTMKRGGSNYLISSLIFTNKTVEKTSPILEMKARKNSVEADGMRKSHIRDSVALCEIMMNLVNDIENSNKSNVWDEMKVVRELEEARRQQKLNMGLSFETISAFGPNSALPHYKVSKDTNLRIDDSGPLTIDSGGQYLDGTIDTTRVVRAGMPTESEIDVYTAILRGIIDLANTVFPERTEMTALDFIARRPLYQSGRDFGHGITHGTGSFLNVHEAYNGSLMENFVGSQEPGYYKENEYGMRLENLVIVVPAEVKNHTKKKLLTFEALTLVPYERKLINTTQMDESEIRWLNDYHKKVRDLVGIEMLKQNKTELYSWLIKQTEPLQ